MTELTVRPSKRLAIKEARTHYFVNEDINNLQRVVNGTILPVRRYNGKVLGGVLDAEGEFIPFSANEDGMAPITQGYSADCPKAVINETAAYCGYFNFQWGHFLFETLSRLGTLLNSPLYEQIDVFVFITDEGRSLSIPENSNYAEVFRLLGIEDKIAIINTPTNYSEIIVPREGFVIEQRIDSAFISVFDAVREKALVGHKKNNSVKIILGRSCFPKARHYEIGIEDIERHFQLNGYRIIHPEQTPLHTLIKEMADASEIVTFSGSVAHNLLFAPSGAKVTLIERYPYVNFFQTAYDILRKPDITYVDANMFLRPVSPGCGPFLLNFNKYFNNYCCSNGLTIPDNVPERIMRKRLRRFLRLHKREYRSNWQMPSWLEIYSYLMEEAACENDATQIKEADNFLFKLSLILSPYMIVRGIYRTLKGCISKISGLMR